MAHLHDGHAQIRDLLTQMCELTQGTAHFTRIERLADTIECVSLSYATPPEDLPWAIHRMSNLETKILTRLAYSLGKPVSKEALFQACYADRVDNPPQAKIIDVMICKIRVKLRHSAYEIPTHCGWNAGYTLRKRLAPDQGTAV